MPDSTKQQIIRVTKEFGFEMAHALLGYDGACMNIHGHSYQMSVTIIGPVNNTIDDPKKGMVLDFSLLKEIVASQVLAPLDHALLLNRASEPQLPHLGKEPFGKVTLVDYQPTCENILVDIASKIRQALPAHVSLHHLSLRETPSSYAEWYAEDN